MANKVKTETETGDTFDLIVIGAGPGGYVAAIRAAQLGLKTAVVEREHLGGICLNWGCIPTKALLRSSEILHYMSHAQSYGLSATHVGADLAAIVKRSRGISARLNSGVYGLLQKNGVRIIWGEARLIAQGEIRVTKSQKKAVEPQHPIPRSVSGEGIYKARHIILATGARPRSLPGIEPDGQLIWSYFEALKPDRLPESLMVIGSGAIGIEFASFYNAMGTKVTVVEVMPHILPSEDQEISAMARRRMEKDGLKIISGTRVESVRKGNDRIDARLMSTDGTVSDLTVERVLSAVGVVGNIEGLGLEDLGVKTDRGCVVVDEYGRTNIAGLYAIGDVAGAPMLAHKAEHEGVSCVEKIAGLPHVHPVDKSKIPACTYCHPQIASVGLTEAQARAAGHDVRIGHFPFYGNGKAIALGEEEGLVKTIFDEKTGQLLGAHMVGAEVTELIQGFVISMNLETTEEDLFNTVFPHPTLSEMMHESVLDAYGRAIHK